MSRRLVVTAALALLAAGLVLWPIPYGRVQMLSGGFLSAWLVPAAVAGAVGAGALRQRVLPVALACAAGWVLATLGRIVVEVAADRTSHNLFPFELAIAACVGLAGGLVGAVVGRLVRPGVRPGLRRDT
jgi:hypothetical protein